MTAIATENAKCRTRPLLVTLLASCVLSMPTVAGAQYYGSSTRNDDASTTQQQSREESRQVDRQAAASQTSTGNSDDRFEPDRIDDSTENVRDDEAGTSSRRSTERPADRNDADANDDRSRRYTRAPRLVPPSEFEKFVSEIVDKPLRRFGANLLVPAARDFTTPPTTTVPPDYRINPGDELVLGFAGSVEASNLRLTVDSDGRIFVPRVGALNVGGVRYGDLSNVISARVSRVYRSFQVSVSAGRLRGITVYVTGFAATPGSYTLSSLSTLVNAVLAAGGPSSGGSFRSIQLRRAGQLVADFDLYDLLLKGDKRADLVLQNGDVIFIAPVGAQVAVIGSVNNEAIFEAGVGDTLNQVLLYAGGINTVADDTRLLLLDSVRADAQGWQQLAPGEVSTRLAKRGEVLRVLSAVGIARPLAQQPVLVTVSGEVSKPGRYYVPAGSRLDDVVAQAGGLTAQAYPFASVVTRESARVQQRLSYDRAIREMELLLTTQPLINVNSSGNGGAALQPQQLVLLQSVVSQLRQREPDGRMVLNIPVDATAMPASLTLENNDSVYIPPRPTTVGVFGAVPSPATFEYDPALTIGDLIKKAGGIQQIGDKGQVYVIRANGSLLAPKNGLFRGSIRSQPALPGDTVFVPVDADRGLFWQRFRDVATTLFSGALAAATVASVSQ